MVPFKWLLQAPLLLCFDSQMSSKRHYELTLKSLGGSSGMAWKSHLKGSSCLDNWFIDASVSSQQISTQKGAVYRPCDRTNQGSQTINWIGFMMNFSLCPSLPWAHLSLEVSSHSTTLICPWHCCKLFLVFVVPAGLLKCSLRSFILRVEKHMNITDTFPSLRWQLYPSPLVPLL